MGDSAAWAPRRGRRPCWAHRSLGSEGLGTSTGPPWPRRGAESLAAAPESALPSTGEEPCHASPPGPQAYPRQDPLRPEGQLCAHDIQVLPSHRPRPPQGSVPPEDPLVRRGCRPESRGWRAPAPAPYRTPAGQPLGSGFLSYVRPAEKAGNYLTHNAKGPRQRPIGTHDRAIGRSDPRAGRDAPRRRLWFWRLCALTRNESVMNAAPDPM
ncbi:uncharacterized protein [Manis javanica]|uniref:uncharacterized protein n=1 Tax=Manis javanica TaxID=9974 RepID=UPI003C6CFA3F